MSTYDENYATNCCTFCNASFNSTENLQKHIGEAHFNVPKEKSHKKEKKEKKHKVKKHYEKCELCSARFPLVNMLLNHYREEHPEYSVKN